MKAKNYEHLIGRIQGLSEKQLRAHFGLYEGYVKKINEIESKLPGADRGAPNYSYNEYSELKRRQAVPFNGAHLHELYFENLTGQSGSPQGELAKAIARDFGSLENWWADAQAGLSSCVGWVLLTRSRFDGRLFNNMIEEHHRDVMCGQEILLALDGWEHAYMIDYGTAKKDYLAVLQRSIDWAVAGRRFEQALRTGTLEERGAA
jgi:Fe-Mn family superoxide dismutase